MERLAEITRNIGIDAGHRVPQHQSKCKNFHGHRYGITATCAAPLVDTGEQFDMVMDFGFLKQDMMAVIDDPCDHGMILWVHDPYLSKFLTSTGAALEEELNRIKKEVSRFGWWSSLTEDDDGEIETISKLYVLANTPTAEVLAAHWFERLSARIFNTQGRHLLKKICVQETPNCTASYPPY